MASKILTLPNKIYNQPDINIGKYNGFNIETK